ncbi:MAG TPA: PilZ domain-containing protein [Terriglobales bacterium]|jgi:PilZ domain|nr:PilZ domain-containing protein [Terriglobales bacterium]
MERAPVISASPITSGKKSPARAALVDLKDPVRNVIVDCFRQFGVETVIMSAGAEDRLRREKFEACVVRLGPTAEPVMEAARTSASNSRIVLYGLGGTAQEAMRFSKYGINAIFREPLERPAAIKLVRATQMLVQHELRRYVRIPVITEVAVVLADNRRLTATSVEVSSGGMSMRSAEDLSNGQAVEVSFALLTLPRVWVRGAIVWRNAPGKTFGVRFDNTDDRRLRIKDWIEAYLEN